MVPCKKLHYPSQKFHTISIDTFGEQALSCQHGFKLVLTVIDRLSNFVQLFPLKTKSWKEIEKTLMLQWFQIFGKPKEILADNAFNQPEPRSWAEQHEIAFTYSGAHAHHQNGHVERFHKYLVEQMKILKAESGKECYSNRWTHYLPLIALRYNVGVLSRRGVSPYEIVFGKSAAGVISVDYKSFSHKLDQKIMNRLGCWTI